MITHIWSIMGTAEAQQDEGHGLLRPLNLIWVLRARKKHGNNKMFLERNVITEPMHAYLFKTIKHSLAFKVLLSPFVETMSLLFKDQVEVSFCFQLV